MKKIKNEFIKVISKRLALVIAIFGYGLIISNSYESKVNAVSNINGVRSIQAVHMIDKYDNRTQKLTVLHVNTMAEAREYGASMPISFTGQMTAYRPNCKGCTGRVSCPPRQDVTNGNIWYQDEVYGKVRILAADPNIPCGTIVKITNVTFSSDEIIGIVLDRGGAIKGNIMDFLVSETDDMDVVGRQHNVNYEVVRWGW